MATFEITSSTQVLIIDLSGAIRHMLSSLLRQFGIQTIHSAGSIKEGIGVLSKEDIDWVIAPLFSTSELTGIHLLRLGVKEKPLHKVHISLLVDDSENELIPMAFASGLFTFHRIPITHNSMTDDLKRLSQLMIQHNHDSTRIASDWMRQWAMEHKKYEHLVHLEDRIYDYLDQSSAQLLRTAEANLLAQKTDRGQDLLKSANLLDFRSKAMAESLARKYLQKSLTTGEPILSIGHAVVIDHDTAATEAVVSCLTKMGCARVSTYLRAEDALRHIKQSGEEPGIIICEWKVPGVNGTALVQELRHAGFRQVPVVVHSSLVERADFELLKEVGVSQVVTKPVTESSFIPTVTKVVNENLVPTGIDSIERKVRMLIASGSVPEALELAQPHLEDETIAKSQRNLLAGEIAFAQGKYEVAHRLTVEALAEIGPSSLPLDLLGRSLIKLQDMDAALNCLMKAQEYSPANVERLCRIAEVELVRGESGNATTNLNRAKKISQNIDLVHETEAKIALNVGDVATARSSLSKLADASGIVPFLNNRAVALAQKGNFKESEELYQRALDALPKDDQKTRTQVKYNLGLLLTRAGRYEQATPVLDQASKTQLPHIWQKATSLKNKVTMAIRSGMPVVLNNGDGVELESVVGGAPKKKMINLQIDTSQYETQLRPGDRCLFLVFSKPGRLPAAAKKFFSELPSFHKSKKTKAS